MPRNPALAGVDNVPAPDISYFTPYQNPKSGTAADPQSDGSRPPKLFQPWKLRGLTFQNRIGLSPLCQYSADNGHLTDWHVAHLGGIALRGPGFMMIEATAVQAEGRISPQDSGLWTDSQIAPLKRVVEFAHSQNQLIGIQLGHAGRKASTFPPWLALNDEADETVGGWPQNVKGPGNVPYSDALPTPKAMTKADIAEFKEAWAAAVRRALAAGVDFIEIHNAHGYLLFSFLSPASNVGRQDEYGGSFENRVRLTREIIALTRELIPKDMPLFIRVSATDWLTRSRPDLPSWTLEDTCRLAKLLADDGQVDFIDVSSGGNHPDQKFETEPGAPTMHYPLSRAVKAAVGDRLAVGVVGGIKDGKTANAMLEDGGIDAAIVGRYFQKNPAMVWQFAEDLGVDVKVANQIGWAFSVRGSTAYLKNRPQRL